MMRYAPPRRHMAADVESLESRQLLTLVSPATVPESELTDHSDCGCYQPGAIVVDDDRKQCPNARFTSIQAAVLAAPPGSTIRVCPGVYNEIVEVPKTLRLLGARAGQDADCRCGRTPDPSRDSIIQFPAAPTGIVSLQANDIEFDGFVVRNNQAGQGIYTSPLFSGYLIENNVIRNNVFGLYFHSGGADRSVVQDNCFYDNNVAGSASGNGIYSDQGLRNALITDNRFEKHTNASIVLAAPAPGVQRDIDITHNKSINDGSIALFRVTNARISRNFSYNSSGSGIFLGGDTHDVYIECNAVFRATFSGVATNNPFAYGPNTDVLIRNNLLMDNGEAGISMRHITHSQALYNHAIRNGRLEPGDGIRLGMGAFFNDVKYNVADRNRRDGIRAEEEAANNHIVRNRMRHNREHDAHDDTFGPGTAGTANFWIDNDCRTQNRPGLCDHCDCRCGDGRDDYDDRLSDDERNAVLSHEALVDQDTSLISLEPEPLPLIGSLLPMSSDRKYA